ncbi:MAG: S1 family peptidase [Armatimonadota bacterium]
MRAARLFLATATLSAGLAAPWEALSQTFPAARVDDPTSRAQAVVERVRTKIAVLKIKRPGTTASATGFLASPRLVVTAAHALDDAESFRVWMNGVAFRPQTVALHPEHDVASVRLAARELHLKPAELAATSSDLINGEELRIVAGPSQPRNADADPARRVIIPAQLAGRVELVGRAGARTSALALHASVNRGDSGSPVVRLRDGKVIGVLCSRELPDNTGVSRVAYAVPVELLQPWLARLEPRRGDQRADEEFYLLPRR